MREQDLFEIENKKRKSKKDINIMMIEGEDVGEDEDQSSSAGIIQQHYNKMLQAQTYNNSSDNNKINLEPSSRTSSSST